MHPVHQLPARKKKSAFMTYLSKPMHETTIADTLLIHATTVILTITIGISVQGWIALAQDVRTRKVIA